MAGTPFQALAAVQNQGQSEPLPYYFVVSEDGSLAAREIDSQFLYKLLTMGVDIMPYLSTSQNQSGQGQGQGEHIMPGSNSHSRWQ